MPVLCRRFGISFHGGGSVRASKLWTYSISIFEISTAYRHLLKHVMSVVDIDSVRRYTVPTTITSPHLQRQSSNSQRGNTIEVYQDGNVPSQSSVYHLSITYVYLQH